MIYLECYADEALVKSFGVTSKMIKHAFNKGEVCNLLSKSSNNIGIVDEDPNSGKSKYERQMLTKIVFENQLLKVCEDKSTNNKLIVLRPRLEDFIIRIARESNLLNERIPMEASKLYEFLTQRRSVQKFELFKDFIQQLSKGNETMIKFINFIK